MWTMWRVSLPVWGGIGKASPSNVSLLAHFSSFSPLLILQLLQCVPLELAVFFSNQSNISGKVDLSVFPLLDPLFLGKNCLRLPYLWLEEMVSKSIIATHVPEIVPASICTHTCSHMCVCARVCVISKVFLFFETVCAIMAHGKH